MERNFHRRWGLTSPVHQGDHGGAVKTIAQGMPFVSGGPCECACVFSFIAREAAGASSIRHSLRPLSFEGARISCKTRARGVARTRWRVYFSPLLPYAEAALDQPKSAFGRRRLAKADGGEGSGVGVLQRTHWQFDSRRHPHPRPRIKSGAGSLPTTRKSALEE